MTEVIRIEQALFGYREGHHLVASSVPLSPPVRQFLANVTDGSGPENYEGFEVCFTGMGVPGTDFYAFFCTWPAPEMPRPGCVWSHVLLIDLTDVGRIPDLSLLRGLCLRPATPPLLDAYGVSLGLTLEGRSVPGVSDAVAREKARTLLSRLYGSPQLSIAILDTSAGNWETSVFQIWSQQWPRLRRHFTFSTGSLGDRQLAEIRFDLQIAPRSSQRLWGRVAQETLVVDAEEPTPDGDAMWLQTALDDLEGGSQHRLREFFASYGSDIEEPRVAFRLLAERFDLAQHNDDDDAAFRLSELATAFPQPSEAVRLKERQVSVLAAVVDDSAESIWALVFFLVASRQAAAFERVAFDFQPHIQVLWKRKRADVLALAGREPEGPRSVAFLLALASALAPADVPVFWAEQGGILGRIIAQQPVLATQADAWSMPQSGQIELWDALRSATTSADVWAATCAAMLSAGCTVREQETVELAQNALYGGLLSWLRSETFHLPSATWRKALEVPLRQALGAGELPPPLLALTVWTLPRNEARQVSGRRHDVQALAVAVKTLHSALSSRTLFWLATVGLRTPGEAGLALLTTSYFPVYDAVASSNYAGESWELLAAELPEALMGLDWDRCKRLRRALKLWLRAQPSFYVDVLSRAATRREHNWVLEKVR